MELERPLDLIPGLAAFLIAVVEKGFCGGPFGEEVGYAHGFSRVAGNDIAAGAVADRVAEFAVRGSGDVLLRINGAVASAEVVVRNEHDARWRRGLFGIDAARAPAESLNDARGGGVTQFGTAGGDVKKRGRGVGDGGFGVGVFFSETERNAECQCEEGGYGAEIHGNLSRQIQYSCCMRVRLQRGA